MSVLTNTRIVQVVTNNNPFKFVSTDPDLGQVHRVHLKTLVVPNTEYNVNTKTQVVDITSIDMMPVDDLPLGQYTLSALLAALKIVLDVAAFPETFTITQNTLTLKLTFIKSGGTEFTISAESPLRRLIGQSKAKTSVGLILECDSVFDLSGTRLVVLESFTLGKVKVSEGDTAAESQKSTVLGSVATLVPFGGVLKVNETEETLNYCSFPGYKNISTFDLRLVDETGELLELNNTEWLMELEVHIAGAQ